MCRADSRASSVSPRDRSADPRRDRRARATASSASQVSSLRGAVRTDRATAPKNTNKIHSNIPDFQFPVSAVAARQPCASGGRSRSNIASLPWRRPAGAACQPAAPVRPGRPRPARTRAASAFQPPGACVSRWDRPSRFRRCREEKRASSAFHPPCPPSGSVMLPEKMLKSACSHFIISTSSFRTFAVWVHVAAGEWAAQR
jgi:hypothetical protein